MIDASSSREALDQLVALFNKSAVLEESVFPRVVKALVRLAGDQGRTLFAEQLVKERDQHFSSLLASISISVLGEAAVPYLVKALKEQVNLQMTRTATEALSKLGSREAHKALVEIKEHAKHPVAKRIADEKRQELEQAHPARYLIIPTLIDYDPASREDLLEQCQLCVDKELELLLLEYMPEFCEDALLLMFDFLRQEGSANAAKVLGARLSLGIDMSLLKPLCDCLRQITLRVPRISAERPDTWWGVWNRHHDILEIAQAAAYMLCINKSPLGKSLLKSFLESEHVEVRIEALSALEENPDERYKPQVEKLASSEDPIEVGIAMRVMTALGDTGQIDSMLEDANPSKRAAAADVSLKAGRVDLWQTATSDSDPMVVGAAFDAFANAEDGARPDQEVVEQIISTCTIPESFDLACNLMATTGGASAAKQLVGALESGNPWTISSVFRALRAMRSRGAVRWTDFDEDERRAVLEAIMGDDVRDHVLGLIGAFMEDLPYADLMTIKNHLLKSTKASPGAVQSVVLAVAGRELLLTSRMKAQKTFDEVTGEQHSSSKGQVEAITTLGNIWLRPDTDLGEELKGKLEEWFGEQVEDKAKAPAARMTAIEVLGRAGSEKCLALLNKMSAYPNEALSAKASEALLDLARRFPKIDLSGMASTKPKGQSTVLIAEGDANTSKLFEHFLFQKEIRSVVTDSGKETLAALKSTMFDLVLLDLHLDGLLNYDLLEKIGKMNNPPPTIVMASISDVSTVEQLVKAGAADILNKPVDLKDLLEKVATFLGD